MNYVVARGQEFTESFDFKSPEGKPRALPAGDFSIILERDSFIRKYTVGDGLSKTRTALIWKIAGAETQDFQFNTMYYTLYLREQEISRGVLKIQ